MRFIVPMLPIQRELELYLQELAKRQIFTEQLVQYVLVIWEIINQSSIDSKARHQFQTYAYEVVFKDLMDASQLTDPRPPLAPQGIPLATVGLATDESEGLVLMVVEACELIYQHLYPYLQGLPKEPGTPYYDYINVEGWIGSDLILEAHVIRDARVDYVTASTLPLFM